MVLPSVFTSVAAFETAGLRRRCRSRQQDGPADVDVGLSHERLHGAVLISETAASRAPSLVLSRIHQLLGVLGRFREAFGETFPTADRIVAGSVWEFVFLPWEHPTVRSITCRVRRRHQPSDLRR